MIKNFLKIAFRNLLRSKGISLINIGGLTLGMTSAIFILLWVKHELSFDRFHLNGDRIFMMYNRNTFDGELRAISQTPYILATSLKENYPEVENVVRFNNVTFLMSVGDKHLNVRGAFADSGFLNMFSYSLLEGDASGALNGVNHIVLTHQLAIKLFGAADPMGRIVRIDSSNNFTVTAVLKDLPNNTQFEFEYLLPHAYMTSLGWDDGNWTNNFTFTYVLLKPGCTQSAFDQKVKDIIINHTKGARLESKAEVFTQPLIRTYLYSRSENGQLIGGRIEKVRLFSLIAAFILLVACINFMNLSTARSERRAKEVGIRKVVGAGRKSLIFQFLGESILITSISFIISVILVQVGMPAFNRLVEEDLSINFANGQYWFFAIGFVLFTGIVAGSYPAFFLASFRPVKVLKSAFRKANGFLTPRKVLVVVQFCFAIILIISTIIVLSQLKYAQSRDVGYDKNNLIFTFTQGDVIKHYDAIRNELLSSGAAVSVSQSRSPITDRWSSGWGFQWPGSVNGDEKIDFVQMGSNTDFIKTMGARLVKGRDIDMNKYLSDSSAMLLNESAVKAMHLTDPIGKIVTRVNYPDRWQIVGVIKDFILESPYEKVNPTMITGVKDWYPQVLHIKLNPANSITTDITRTEEIFKRYNPQYPFDFVFVDESFARKFREEERAGKLSGIFAGLTIFISCLGLFGLATFMAEDRVKEIGVRKVLGASITSITALLSKDFLKLVFIAALVAFPITWWVMNQWLQTFTYRVNINWWIFIVAGVSAMLIALFTISFQTIRAALGNPASALRNE
jgi:putative ABC transport system permease protein